MKIPGMKHGAELCVGRSAGLVIAEATADGEVPPQAFVAVA